MKNKKNTLKIIISVIGITVGILLIGAGILIFWNEGFNNFLVKIISFLKDKSPYLLVEGKPVYMIWLVKLISLGKWSIITGGFIFLLSLIIFLDTKYQKVRLVKLTFFSVIGFFLIVIGLLILMDKDFNNLFIKFFSNIVNEFPLLMESGKTRAGYLIEVAASFGRFSLFAGVIIFLFSLATIIDKRLNESIIFKKYNALIIFKKGFYPFSHIGISSVVILLIIILGLISWPVSDDFSIYVNIRSSGVLGNAWNMYTGWNGRFFDLLLHVPLFQIFKFGYSHLIVAFNAVCLVLISYVLSIFLTKITGNKKLIYYDFAVILVVLWLGLIPIINEVVYWAAGGIYIFTSAFIIFWILIIYLILFNAKLIRFKYFTIPILMIFSFLIGGVGQTVSPALIFITIVMLILARKKEKDRKMIGSLALIFLILGTIAMYTAPGNFIRAEHMQGSFNFNAIVILKNYIYVFIVYSNLAKEIIVLAIFGGFSSAIFKARNNLHKSKNTFPHKRNDKERLIIIFSFLGAALVSLLPFTMIFDFIVSRAGIYYLLFLFIFTWGIVDYFSVPFIRNYRENSKRVIALAMIPVICFSILSFSVIALSSKNFYTPPNE